MSYNQVIREFAGAENATGKSKNSLIDSALHFTQISVGAGVQRPDYRLSRRVVAALAVSYIHGVVSEGDEVKQRKQQAFARCRLLKNHNND